MSVFLYKMYNSRLLEVVDEEDRDKSLGFLDDVAVVAVGENLEQTTAMLQSHVEQQKGAKEWLQKQNSRFKVSKLCLVHADQPQLQRADELGPPLELSNGEVQPSEATKFLGIWVNRKLSFKQPAEFALKKGTNWIMQFGRLARPKHGLSAKNVQSLYKKVLLPGMLYVASVWIKPQQRIEGWKQVYGSIGIIRQMEQVHCQACRLISGAMRSTPMDSMQAQLNLLPFHLLVDDVVMREATHMCTLLETHLLHKHVQHAAKWVKHHQSLLHDVMVAYSLHPDAIETIETVQQAPS